MPSDENTRAGLVGREIGGCRIEQKIGRGGMGTVYKAHQISLDRTVALKILPEAVSDDRDYIARFEREARMIAALNHVSIVRVFDLGMDPSGQYYIVMEYVEGGPLTRKGRLPLPEDEALRCIAQAADGLAAAHAKGILHRDVKPDNILGRHAWISDPGALECTNPAGKLKPNGFGLFDTHGNAWEWCEDSPRKYDTKEQIDPVGATWSQRAVRGGYFLCSPDDCRSASRSRWNSNLRYNGLGFRVVMLLR